MHPFGALETGKQTPSKSDSHLGYFLICLLIKPDQLPSLKVRLVRDLHDAAEIKLEVPARVYR